eukprot:3005612-Rhodomonas_salina.1
MEMGRCKGGPLFLRLHGKRAKPTKAKRKTGRQEERKRGRPNRRWKIECFRDQAPSAVPPHTASSLPRAQSSFTDTKAFSTRKAANVGREGGQGEKERGATGTRSAAEKDSASSTVMLGSSTSS